MKISQIIKKAQISIVLTIIAINSLAQCANDYLGSYYVRGCSADTMSYCTATIKAITPNKILITHFACIPYVIIGNTVDTIYADLNCAKDSLTLETVAYYVGEGSLIYSGTGSLTPDSIEINYYQINPDGSQFLCYNYVRQPLGISQLNPPDKKIDIYPNPASRYINVDTKEPISDITAMDVLGRAVRCLLMPNNTIDISNLDKGLYLAKLNFKDNTVLPIKFIKE